MQVSVVFFAHLRRATGVETVQLDIPAVSTVRALAETVEQQFGISLRGCMVAVNETYARPEQALNAGDEVAFLPPVAGGSKEAQHHHNDYTLTEIVESELSLDTAARFLLRPAHGAQAYFVGTVRSPNQGKQVEFIEYEGFAPMARKVMQEAATAARTQFGELGVFIQHRVGKLLPGEASILIGVSSPHRRAALEACDFLIEFLKVQVPVWKHEVDETGSHWVKGTAAHDTL